MPNDEIRDFLAKIELFKDLADDELALLSTHIKPKDYQPGALLFSENSPRKFVYLIFKGEVELYKTSPYGEETRLAFFRKYDFLSEGALMDD
jgi:CRP-like cAMP-binding protein